MKKRGISLIVLVITIIVIIILAVAVILSIANNNPIENAKKAAFQNDIATLKEELDLYIQKQYVDSQGTYKASDLNKSGEDIKDILPDIKDKYIGKIAINGGSLEYTDESNMQEYNWASETLTGENTNYDKAVSSDSKNIQINNAIADKLGNLRIYGNSIQNGTPTPDSPVEIQSVGELVTDANASNYGKYKIPITVEGKNLIPYPYVNTTKTVNGVSLKDNGDGTITISGVPTASISYYLGQVSVKTGISYTLSGMDIGKNLVFILMEYDESGTKIRQENSRNISYKASDNASYIRIYIDRINSNTEIPETVVRPQLEIGSSSTKYEQYQKSITTNIFLNEPLRKVGDAVDYIDLKNKKVVRNVKERVFDGTERWELGASGTNVVNQRFFLSDSDLLSNGRLLSNILVEKYPGKVSIFTQDVEGCNISNYRFYQLKINKTYLTNLNYDVSVSGFKKYLSDLKNENKPVKVCATLESKTEEKILNLPEISTINGINNISIGTSINPSKIEAVYSKEK